MRTGVDVAAVGGAEQWAELVILCCREDRRVPGLGTALTSKALQLLSQRGTSVCITIATSAYSSRIFRKLGFRELRAVPYCEYIRAGKVVFPTTQPHTHARIFLFSGDC